MRNSAENEVGEPVIRPKGDLEDSCITEIPSGISLRSELSIRGLRHAITHGYVHDRTDGVIPSILFNCNEEEQHGYFHPLSYECIRTNPAWSKRLEKAHTAYRRVRARADWAWKELDCSNSSDALLMNIFCYPELSEHPDLKALLGIEVSDVPEFGFKPKTQLENGRFDNTEFDMKIGSLLVEAKLTESNFQSGDSRLVHRYRDFNAVFENIDLPIRKGKYVGYQLIRGVLGAYAHDCSFCVFCDERRPDLIEIWYSVMRSVRFSNLRCQLKIVTWQELAACAPVGLRCFLSTKYGIEARKRSFESVR